MSSPSISLCMIVKNEAVFIERCLKSVCHVVNEIIVVDTGSTDETIDICKKYEATILPFEWKEHFAEARNFGVNQAKSDWILWLDADEELEDGYEELLRSTLASTKAQMLLMPVINYSGESFPVQENEAFIYAQPRLFRNHIGIQFYNRIHESPMLPDNITSSDSISQIEIPIHHYGYIQEVTKRKNKAQRNLNLLQKEYQTSNHSPWIEYHLASEHYRLGNYPIAFDYLNESILKFIKNGKLPPAILYRLKYDILVKTGSFNGAISGIDKAILLYPDYVDLHFLKGFILYHNRHYKDALACFEKCLELGEHNPKYLIMKGTGSYRALQYQQLCLQQLES